MSSSAFPSSYIWACFLFLSSPSSRNFFLNKILFYLGDSKTTLGPFNISRWSNQSTHTRAFAKHFPWKTQFPILHKSKLPRFAAQSVLSSQQHWYLIGFARTKVNDKEHMLYPIQLVPSNLVSWFAQTRTVNKFKTTTSSKLKQ